MIQTNTVHLSDYLVIKISSCISVIAVVTCSNHNLQLGRIEKLIYERWLNSNELAATVKWWYERYFEIVKVHVYTTKN